MGKTKLQWALPYNILHVPPCTLCACGVAPKGGAVYTKARPPYMAPICVTPRRVGTTQAGQGAYVAAQTVCTHGGGAKPTASTTPGAASPPRGACPRCMRGHPHGALPARWVAPRGYQFCGRRNALDQPKGG